MGVTTALGDFTDEFGPIILLVVAAALGLYGVKLAYSWITNLIRVRAAR